jgi:hypothetical protein
MPRTSKQQSTAVAGPRLVKTSTPTVPVHTDITYEQIAARAYELFERDGFVHGNHVDHWLRAEHELKQVVLVESPKRIAAPRARRSD